MSGTSLDGLDICHVQFQKEQHWTFRILHAETITYSQSWKKRLENAFTCDGKTLMQLHSDYGYFLGEEVRKFTEKHHIHDIDIVASHGHTIFHQPSLGYTTQIGDGRWIRLLTGFPTVYDFRTQDVMKGGNGAPLVPIGDELLFPEYDACINLGGFSNISFKQNGKRIAFDISPVNIVLNFLAQKLGMPYDRNGDTARKGKIDKKILSKLNVIEYYSRSFPKSLGKEWVEECFLPEINALNPIDALATCTEHFAWQAAQVINACNLQKILISGGGAMNVFLMEKIRCLTPAKIHTEERMITDFKEALIFAFMGLLRLRNENNILSSATGSLEDHCSGILV